MIRKYYLYLKSNKVFTQRFLNFYLFRGSGKIQTNKEDQTVVPHIYCIGDNALGKPELTPVAIAAGRLLAERLYGDKTTLVRLL